MHRILQNIPRGVLRNFISKPVPKCREDEKAQKAHHSNQIVQQQRLSHNRAILYEVVRSTNQNEGSRGCGTEKDQEGKGDRHQKRTFTQEFWNTYGRPANTAEVVGWGALVILGVQLGKLYPKHQSFGEGEKNPYCPVHWFDLITGILGEKPSLQAARKVLSNDFSLEYDSILSQHENRESACDSPEHSKELSNDASELKNEQFSATDISAARRYLEVEAFQPASIDRDSEEFRSVLEKEHDPHGTHFEKTNRSPQNRSIPEDRLSLHQAGNEWDRLTQRFTNLILNQAGLQRAGRGKLTEAVAFWNNAECATAHYNLAVCYENGRNVDKDLEKACQHYEMAGTQGHIMAQYNLAVLCLEGGKGVKKDPDKALRLLESAAKRGLKQAQTELGVLYTEEERKNMEKAAELFKMAAEQKDKNGRYYLGICYENGWGVPQNHCKAAEMYRLAAKDGHATAQYNLATFFEHGLGGIPQDKKTAADLYEKAELLGEQGAEKEAKRLREEIQQLVLDEHFRWQFDGGTNILTESRSSPVLHPSNPSLAHYINEHLPEFGFADLALKLDSESGSPPGSPVGSLSRRESASSGVTIKFHLGAEDSKDMSTRPGESKFWSDEDDDMDSLALGQNPRGIGGGAGLCLDRLGLQGHRSLSMIELPGLGASGSHPLRVS